MIKACKHINRMLEDMKPLVRFKYLIYLNETYLKIILYGGKIHTPNYIPNNVQKIGYPLNVLNIKE